MAKLTHILVVDDDRALAELLRRILTKRGYQVTVAFSGEEALEQSQQQRFDMALLDVMLPGMDGYTVCRHLRSSPRTQYLPVLMLTAKGDIADKISGFEAGADDYLTKPFQPKKLVYRVESLLSRVQATEVEEARKSKRGRLIAVFGSKGGVGKTTIATNLAVALRQRRDTRVVLVDGDLSFGDVGVHLNLPAVRTMLDLVRESEKGERSLEELLGDQSMILHSSGLRVLLSPRRPEEGESLTKEHMDRMLDYLCEHFDFVIVDCQPSYDDRMLTVLQAADDILMIVTPEVGPLKNTSLFLDWAAKLGFSLNKVNVVLNRFNSNVGIGPEEIERTLQHEVTFRIISGGRPVVLSVNRGVPLVIEQPDHPFSMQVARIADHYLELGDKSPLETLNHRGGQVGR